MRYFGFSFLVTFVGLALATWWGYSRGGMTVALQTLWVVSILAVLEISLSFDNAVVNAAILKTWNNFWQDLFLTLGMLIAVFGMR